MLIDCPACARSYHVSREAIGATGRAVICPRCDARWSVDADGRQVGGSEVRGPEVQAVAVSERAAPKIRPTRPRTSLLQRLRPLVAVAGCIVFGMGAIAERQRIVRFVPRTARLYAAIGLPVNVRGLDFAKIATARLDPVTLKVSGEIRNVAQRKVSVPRVAYEVRDAAGVELARWTERAPARTLAAGQTLPFVTSPHDVPAGAQSVFVQFEP